MTEDEEQANGRGRREDGRMSWPAAAVLILVLSAVGWAIIALITGTLLR